jgi:serine-type D-Ala-D-Ala carboxypeptidase/endopeptidase
MKELSMRYFRQVVVLVGLVVFCSNTFAQKPDSKTDRQWTLPTNAEVRDLLAERMAHNGVGTVVGLIDPGGKRIVVYGRSGAANRRPLDGDTVFQIGSVTKVFTGLLLADMVKRGEVKLEDPAAMYLPDGVKMPERGRPITLIDLSKHWSGLPSMPANFPLDGRPNPYQAYTVEQLYDFLSSYQPTREPGKQEYSNLGVALLGRLLARRAGVEYDDLLKQRVIAPLRLNSTSIALNADQKRRLAPGHDQFLQPVETWELRTTQASGSLRSTANDLLTFLAFNLGLQESPLASAIKLQRVPGRALGWGALKLGGESVYGHEGGKEGYRSAVVFNPRTRTGVVILTNARTNDSPMELARHLLFSGSPLAPARSAPTRPKIVPMPRKTLDSYEGTYRLESGSLIRIARRDDHLLIYFMDGGGIATLFPTGKHQFFSNTSDALVDFEARSADRVTGLTLQTGNTTQKATRVEIEARQ